VKAFNAEIQSEKAPLSGNSMSSMRQSQLMFPLHPG
jgi:hypothetical protein